MLTGKQQPDLGSATCPQKPDGVVLIVLREFLAVFDVASFANHIDELTFADGSELHPRLKPERVALAEPDVGEAASFVILDQNGALMSCEGHGFVAGFKTGVPRRPWSRGRRAELANPCAGLRAAIEAPFENWFSGSCNAGCCNEQQGN